MNSFPGGPCRRAAFGLSIALATACGSARNLTVRAAPDLATVGHRRIAVLPFARAKRAIAPQDAEEILTGQLHAALAGTGRFSVSPPDTVADVERALGGEGTTAADAARVGERLGVDLVLAGTVSLYVERVGGDYGVESPASVEFTVDVIEAGTGREIWHGKFAEEQKPLLVDLGGIESFFKRGGKWQTAVELSDQGVRQVVGVLEVAWFGVRSGVATAIPKAAATPACTTCPR